MGKTRAQRVQGSRVGNVDVPAGQPCCQRRFLLLPATAGLGTQSEALELPLGRRLRPGTVPLPTHRHNYPLTHHHTFTHTPPPPLMAIQSPTPERPDASRGKSSTSSSRSSI